MKKIENVISFLLASSLHYRDDELETQTPPRVPELMMRFIITRSPVYIIHLLTQSCENRFKNFSL